MAVLHINKSNAAGTSEKVVHPCSKLLNPVKNFAFWQWRIQEGAVWGNCPTTSLWRPFEWRPFAINAPFLVPMEIEKIKKYSKIYNVFRLVKPQDLRAGLYSTCYRKAWILLLFRNGFTVSLFLRCRVRSENCTAFTPSQTQSRSLNTILDLQLCCMKMVCFFTSLFF